MNRTAIYAVLALIGGVILYILIIPKILRYFKGSSEVDVLDIQFTSVEGCIIITNIGPTELSLDKFWVYDKTTGKKYTFGKGTLKPFSYARTCINMGDSYELYYEDKLLGFGVAS